MSDLTDFLLARIAEDEAVARAATPGPWEWDNDEFSDAEDGACEHRTEWTDHGPDLVNPQLTDTAPDYGFVISAIGYDASHVNVRRSDALHIARWNPAGVLAECEAKRRIVEAHPDGHEPGEAIPFCATCEPEGPWNLANHRYPCTTQRLLALPYADHPDYREEWRA